MNIYLVLVWLFSIMDRDVLATNSVLIEGEGIIPVLKGDIGLIFYLSVRNICHTPMHLVVRGLECCVEIAPDDTDCKFMKLFGGDFGDLEYGTQTNVTLVYPNLFVENRVGFCEIGVYYTPRDRKTQVIQHKVSFNTTLTKKSPLMRSYFHASELSPECLTVDLNPLDGCNPYNCHMRYSGSRNYFDYMSKRCRRVPNCCTKRNTNPPDVAYLPTSNTCRDLTNGITQDDIDQMLQSIRVNDDIDDSSAYNNVRCHNGHMDNRTGICVCDAGWASSPWEHDALGPSTSPLDMCTLQMSVWGPDSVSTISQRSASVGVSFSYHYDKFVQQLHTVCKTMWTLICFWCF